MTDPNTIANIGDLTKPATVLIEKIAEGAGVLTKPSRIRQEAKAKADEIVILAQAKAEEELIQAETKIEISDLERRASIRRLREEAQHQANMESIVAGSIPLLKGYAAPEKIENDWIANVFAKCRIVSDREMQQVWSRLLAGEANKPGSFSKKTVNLIPDLEKSDAELFTNLCKFCWTFEEQNPEMTPIIIDDTNEIYNKQKIGFDTLEHLKNLGLINFAVGTVFSRTELPTKFKAFYYGQQVDITLPDRNRNGELRLGLVTLTKAGKELALICGSEALPEFFEYVKSYWGNQGLIE